MNFKDRYELLEINVGGFVLKQFSSISWGYKTKITRNELIPIFACYSEERKRWTIMLDYMGPNNPTALCEFHNRYLDEAIKMAEAYISAVPFTPIGEPCQ